MNGYAQVNIGGKLRGWKWTKMTAINYMQILNLSANQSISDVPNGTQLIAMVYSGLSMNCFLKGDKADFNLEDVAEWCEDAGEDVFLEIQKASASASYLHTSLDKKKELASAGSQQVSGGKVGRKK